MVTERSCGSPALRLRAVKSPLTGDFTDIQPDFQLGFDVKKLGASAGTVSTSPRSHERAAGNWGWSSGERASLTAQSPDKTLSALPSPHGAL